MNRTQSILECLDATQIHLKVVRRVQRQAAKLPKRLATDVGDVVVGMEMTVAKLTAAIKNGNGTKSGMKR